MTVQELHAAVGPGDRITIVDRFGAERTGSVVMRNQFGFVLNMGGRHGTPGLASPDNIVKIRKTTKKPSAIAKAVF